ncbi:MAG: hypothetical protein COC23_04590 [Hyphomicrobiales bacterium]|nr:MAG: hypothetical protein COC23_04590 [Hyphomicrobiales bacterium]
MKLENTDQRPEDDFTGSGETLDSVRPATNPPKNPKIKIRFAVDADREPVRNLAKWQHEQTVFGDIEFCDEKFDAIFDRWNSGSHNQCSVVSEFDGKMVGFAHATIGEFYLGKNQILTTIHAISVDGRSTSPNRRAKIFFALLGSVKNWSKMFGANRILLSDTSGININTKRKILNIFHAQVIGGNFLL